MNRVIDLTVSVASGDRGVQIEQARRLEVDGWNATTLSLYSHCGTHIDAPVHFGVGNVTIDAISVEDFMGPAWVVDVRTVGAGGSITPEHLGDAAVKFKAGESLLIHTGWSAYYGRDRYRDELPRISTELARWCVANKVRMLGVEPPSVADVNNPQEVTAVHRILFEGGVIVVEGLANLDALTKPKVTFIALPLKIAKGDGAPARAIAIEEDV